MVLAAGHGLRMRPLTLLRAKPVLPVLGRPLLHWTMERLARAGVREVMVNLHHLPDSVTAALHDGRKLGVRVRYSHEPDTVLGTGGGPRAVRDFFGDQPFLLVNGDVLFDFELAELRARHLRSGACATLALRRNPGGYTSVVTDRRGRILAIADRPRPAGGTVSMFASVHVMAPALLERLPDGVSDSVRDLYIPLLGAGERLQGVRCGGAWYDLGRPSLYRDAQLRLLRGRSRVDVQARVSPSALLIRSVAGARARVGPGARIESSVLWDGAVVDTAARVERSIVVEGGVVRRGELARKVIVMPASALDAGDEAGEPTERHGDMAWVGIR
jgi:NDP-sugar pyrophosphorylase family protein